MRLAVVTSHFSPPVTRKWKRGRPKPYAEVYPGVGSLYLLSKKLSEDRGYEITFFTLNLKDRRRYREEVAENFRIKRFPCALIPPAYYVSPKLFRGLLRDEFDIAHSHHFGFSPATIGFAAAKWKGTPHVFSPYYHPPIYGLKKGFLFSLYHLTQGLPILRFSDKVLPQTRYEKEILMETGAKENNMEVVPLPIDTKKFRPLDRGRKGKKIVLYVNVFSPWKGAHVLFEIAEKLLKKRDDVAFVFIGWGMLESDMKKRAAKYGDSFIFLKHLVEMDLIKWYSKADIFALPSYYESFGRVLAEAQACGVPCVSTKVGGVPEVVVDGKTGFLVNYGDWQMMEERIEFLLDHEDERMRMGKNARGHVVKNFDIDVVTERLSRIYESLL